MKCEVGIQRLIETVSYAEAVKRACPKKKKRKKKLMSERSARRERDAVEITKVKGEGEV